MNVPCWICKAEMPEAECKHAVGIGWHCLDPIACKARREPTTSEVRHDLVQKLSATQRMIETHTAEVAMWKARALKAEADLDAEDRLSPWVHCSPELLARGDCGTTPRRECECTPKGSHDHFVPKPTSKAQFERAAEICRDLHKEFGEEQTRLIRHAFMVYFGHEAPDEFDQNVFREACFR